MTRSSGGEAWKAAPHPKPSKSDPVADLWFEVQRAKEATISRPRAIAAYCSSHPLSTLKGTWRGLRAPIAPPTRPALTPAPSLSASHGSAAYIAE
jgi:hypothetical protein